VTIGSTAAASDTGYVVGIDLDIGSSLAGAEEKIRDLVLDLVLVHSFLE
jgi:hypothetical protein